LIYLFSDPGTLPNVGRNAIVNVSEVVCYDIIKELILQYSLMKDSIPCHFTSALIAGMTISYWLWTSKTQWNGSSYCLYKVTSRYTHGVVACLVSITI